MNKRWRTRVVIVAVLWGVGEHAYGAPDDIGVDNARLRAAVAQERMSLDSVVNPWLRSGDVDVELAGALIGDLFGRINALPPAIRVTRGTIFEQNGQIWGWEAECKALGKVYGKEGAYVEFADRNYMFNVDVTLVSLSSSLQAAGLTVSASLHGHAEVGTLRGNRYPCVGGGVGASAGPFRGDADLHVTANAAIAGWSAKGIEYTLKIDLVGAYDISASVGSLGTLRFSANLMPMHTDLGGALSTALATTGILQIPGKVPGTTTSRSYSFDLAQPQAQFNTRGVHASTNVLLQWK